MAEDWIAGLAVVLLVLAWHYLPRGDGPPVVAVAFSFQWVQVTVGLFYYALTGRRVPEMDASDYRPMVLLGLGCLVALLIGISLGGRLLGDTRRATTLGDQPLALRTLSFCYFASLGLSGVVQELAWTFPSLTQGILGLSLGRFVLLILLFRRLVDPRPRWSLLFGLVGLEILLGFTGYFAGFREAIILLGLALLERFDRWRFAHWVSMGALAIIVVLTAVIWTGIKGDYRRDLEEGLDSRNRLVRVEHVLTLVQGWLDQGAEPMVDDLDRLVSRLWAVYYPSLALARVPSLLPHENGAILGRAVLHIATPRVLFSDKLDLPSDSEMVRKYSGVRVAGPEEGTSIAFGYAAESYVDFGVPWMFVPVLIFGVTMGFAYGAVLRVYRHRDIAIAVATVIFWVSLYLFERSWANTLGLTLTFIAYLGGVAFVLDRLLRGDPASTTLGRHAPVR